MAILIEFSHLMVNVFKISEEWHQLRANVLHMSRLPESQHNSSLLIKATKAMILIKCLTQLNEDYSQENFKIRLE